jgi:hypothetical protein
MNEKQAIEVLKTALDLATSKGVFGTLNDSYAVIQAYNVISAKILKDEQVDAPANG